MPKIFADRNNSIFGRAPDLQHLLERSERSGVTAVVSRAQMGKSTLLLELARKLSEPAPASLLGRKSYLVGYTSADQVPDPLLYAIQDLYARWLANSSYAQQANSLYQRHKESLVDRLGESTGTVLEKLSKAAGKPLEATAGIVKTVLDGLVRANQELKAGGLQLPLLPMEQGRDLLQVVHTVSERPLVLILDAWEKSKDLAAQTGLLATFVRGLDEWPQCHIFLASRADPVPLGGISELEAEFPFDVERFDLPLMHLEQDEASAELVKFVHEKVPITEKLSDVEVLELISGYPEVIHRWTRAPRIESFERLEELADDAHHYRFAELKRLLPALEGAQRTLAMRLALLPASSFPTVWKSLESEIMDGVQAADRDALCRKLILESATPPSYGHSKRYEAALEYILGDAPTELTEVAEHMILRLARKIDTLSKANEAASLVRLNSVSSLQLSSGPRVLCLSALSLYGHFILDPSLVITARNELGTDLSSVATLLSMGLLNGCAYATEDDFPRRDALLQELRTLAAACHDNATVRESLAQCLFNTILDAKREDDLPCRDALLQELRTLATTFHNDVAVSKWLAESLFQMLIDAKKQDDLPRRDALLQELRTLATTFPNDAALREHLAGGLFNTLVDAQDEDNLPHRDALLQELRALATAFPEDTTVREGLARVLINTLLYSQEVNDLPRTDTLLQELRALATAFPEDTTVREFLAGG